MKKIQNIKEFNANNINNLFNVGKKSDVPEIINPFISGFKENNKKNYDVSFKKQKFNLPVEFFDLSDMVELVKKEKDVIDNEKTKKYSVDSLGNVTLLESNPVLIEKYIENNYEELKEYEQRCIEKIKAKTKHRR